GFHLFDTLVLGSQFFALFLDNLWLSPGDKRLVGQLALETDYLLASLGDLFVESFQFFAGVNHPGQGQVDLYRASELADGLLRFLFKLCIYLRLFGACQELNQRSLGLQHWGLADGDEDYGNA